MKFIKKPDDKVGKNFYPSDLFNFFYYESQPKVILIVSDEYLIK